MQEKIMDCILKTECCYPENYSNRIETTYGMIFVDDTQKDSINSNHAVILPERVEYKVHSKTGKKYYLKNINLALQEIVSFYQQRGMIPRIYSPYYQGFLSQIEPLLTKYQFHVKKNPLKELLVLTKVNKEPLLKDFRMMRMKYFSEEVIEKMYDKETKKYGKNEIKNALLSPNFHYYIGFFKEEPVAVASVYYSTNVAKVGHLATAMKYRKLGYTAQLLRLIFQQHLSLHSIPMYTYTNNLITRQQCMEAGFVTMNIHLESWSASQNIENE